MELQELNELFSGDFNLDGLVSVRQSWYADSRYNRLEVPRRFHGFFLLTDYPAVFELPDGGRMQATAGDVVLLPKGAHYALSLAVPDGKTAHPYIVNFRLSTPDGGEQLLGDRVLRLCRDEGALLPLFTEAAQLYKKAATAGLKAKVYQLFDTLFPIMQVDECCIAYINRHYTNRFSVPVQYINRLKIEKACQMLRSDDISPGAISDFLNFYSLPYFYKVFRDYMGMTPNQYRDQDGAVQP